jgi:hypothetical protein
VAPQSIRARFGKGVYITKLLHKLYYWGLLSLVHFCITINWLCIIYKMKFKQFLLFADVGLSEPWQAFSVLSEN